MKMLFWVVFIVIGIIVATLIAGAAVPEFFENLFQELSDFFGSVKNWVKATEFFKRITR